MELYNCTQPHLPGGCTRTAGAVPPNGWLAYVKNDE
jgi:hypothetical protein